MKNPRKNQKKRKEKRDLRDSNKIIAKSNICFSKIYLSFAYRGIFGLYLNKIKVNLSTCNALKLNWEIFFRWGLYVKVHKEKKNRKIYAYRKKVRKKST